MREGGKVLSATRGGKLTCKDFVRFPDDGLRHELIDGVHYVTPSPNMRHQDILGRVFFAPFDVVFTNVDIVEPDLLYLSHACAEQALTPTHVRGVPEIVVEIASPGTRKRDATIKRALYERMGVTEYWVIDPEHEIIRVHRHSGDGFAPPLEISRDASGVVTTPLLAGLDIPLARLFRT